MKAFFHNRYIDTIIKSTLLLACIHIITLVLYVLLTGKYQVLNLFSILGLTLFIPQIGQGIVYFGLAIILLLLTFVVVFVVSTGDRDKK